MIEWGNPLILFGRFGIGWELAWPDILIHICIYFVVVWFGSPFFSWTISKLIDTFNYMSLVVNNIFSDFPKKFTDAGHRMFAFSNMSYIRISVAGIFVAFWVAFFANTFVEFEQGLDYIVPHEPRSIFNVAEWLVGILSAGITSFFIFVKLRD